MQNALGVLPVVRGVAAGPAGAISVAYLGEDPSLAEIVRALVVSGIPVVAVEPERSELERIFLEVTRGEIQ